MRDLHRRLAELGFDEVLFEVERGLLVAEHLDGNIMMGRVVNSWLQAGGQFEYLAEIIKNIKLGIRADGEI